MSSPDQTAPMKWRCQLSACRSACSLSRRGTCHKDPGLRHSGRGLLNPTRSGLPTAHRGRHRQALNQHPLRLAHETRQISIIASRRDWVEAVSCRLETTSIDGRGIHEYTIVVSDLLLVAAGRSICWQVFEDRLQSALQPFPSSSTKLQRERSAGIE